MEIKNAIITDIDLLIEDHGFLTIIIYTEHGECYSQAYIGPAFMAPIDSKSRKQFEECPNIMAVFIDRLFAVAGVDNWKKLKGKAIRIGINECSGRIERLGHITKDLWF